MAGTTTNFAIPYPSITDYVTDGATAMKSLADQVDAALFTGASAGNLLINGAMQVTQRSAVGTVVSGLTTTGYNTADRWNTRINSIGTWSQTTLADAPAGSGFRNCLRMQCTTADASPAAGDFLIVQQIIEGQNLQAIRKGTASAQTLTLSFWVASFQTGTFIVEIGDLDNTRSVSKSYTINASNTWEYKTLTFPADVTGGTLNNDNGASIEVNFWLAAGSNYTSGTLQTTWGAAVNANTAVGQTNLASSTSNKWHITGAQLTVGSVATPFEFKSFADDLAACQRYFFKMDATGSYNYYATGAAGSTNGGNLQISHHVPLRSVAHTLLTSNVTMSDYQINLTAGTLTISTALSGTNTTSLAFVSGGAYTLNRPYILLANNNVSSFVSVSAEL